MALPTFNYCPSYPFTVSIRPRVKALQLGGGFQVRTPIGLRPQLRSLSLQFTNKNKDDGQKIWDFFKERSGYKEFHWTPPKPDDEPGIWIATNYQASRNSSGNIVSISVNFEEQ